MELQIANKGLDVGEFYNKLVNLWNELNNHILVPFWTCEGYKFGAVVRIVKMYEEDESHQFLMGLNDDEFLHVCN